jgi:hypothetical protein
MRALNAQDLAAVSGGKATITVDVNVPAKYVHVNLVTDTKTYTLVNIDWSQIGKGAAGAPSAT